MKWTKILIDKKYSFYKLVSSKIPYKEHLTMKEEKLMLQKK